MIIGSVRISPIGRVKYNSGNVLMPFFRNKFAEFSCISGNDFIIAISSIKKKFDIFNICSSKPVLITRVLKEINKYSKKPLIKKKARDKADVYKTYGNNKKILNFLKYKVEFTNHNQGVKKTCEWFLKNKKIFN